MIALYHDWEEQYTIKNFFGDPMMSLLAIVTQTLQLHQKQPAPNLKSPKERKAQTTLN